MTTRRTFALLFLVLGGCSSSSAGFQEPPLATQAQIQAFTRASNVFAVPVDIDGTTALLGVDTGDPFVFLNPTSFPSTPEDGTVGKVTVASQTFTSVPVVTSSQSPASGDTAVVFGGLFGCFILCSSVANFNYRDVVFSLGTPPTVDGVGPQISLPFALEGGGVTQDGATSVTIPTSRVVVDVDIEGHDYRMILDTGASEVVLDADAFAEITADGRKQLSSGGVETTAGVSSAAYSRAKTIAVGTAQASGVLIAHDTSFDTNIATIATETGEAIRGSLGGTFLEHFNLTIDYPAGQIRLSPYTDTSFIFDSARSIGVSFAAVTSAGYVVGSVYDGSDAQTKQVTAGDIIVAVDGQALSGLSSSQVAVLLGGPIGATHAVQFGAATILANRTVSIAVGELLPLSSN